MVLQVGILVLLVLVVFSATVKVIFFVFSPILLGKMTLMLAEFFATEKGSSILAYTPNLWSSCLGIVIESGFVVAVSWASSNDKHPWVLDHVHNSIVNFSNVFPSLHSTKEDFIA